MGSTALEKDYEDLPALQGKLSGESFPNRPSAENLTRRPKSNSTKPKVSVRDAEISVCEKQIREDCLRDNLLKKIKDGDQDAKFLLGQFFFSSHEYTEAAKWFLEIEDCDLQARYQLAVMYYDGLGLKTDYKKAIELIKTLADCKDPKWLHLLPCSQYNLGRAYYEGFGVVQSDDNAEYWWLLAAKDGDADGSVRAQSTLGMFYSRPGEDSFDMEKAHFWHQEATGNGSLESQAVLGVMYLYGLYVEKNLKTSYQCFKSAAERGNIYAIGNMAFYYYKQKLYNNAVDFSQRVICILDPDEVAHETNCLLHYVKKGIALGCFVYGRCLHRGFGIEKDKTQALEYYSKSGEMDLEVANQMQNLMIQGSI